MAARLPCDSLSNGSQWHSMMCPVNGVCRMTVPPAAGPTARPSARVPHDDPPFTTVAAMPVLRCISRRPASGKSYATRNAHRAGQLAQKIE